MHGRFQPFHIGHVHYVKLCLDRAEHVVIAGANPDVQAQSEFLSDGQRPKAGASPFTFCECVRIINESMRGAGVSMERYTITPFPIDDLSAVHSYLPEGTPVYMRNRGAWSVMKKEMFEKAGCMVELIDNHQLLDVSASEVRRRLEEGENWRELVQARAVAVIENTAYGRKCLQAV